MKQVILALAAVLVLGTGAAVVDAQRDRGAQPDDQARFGQGRGARGMLGQMARPGRGLLQGGPGRGGRGRGGPGGPMLAALDLDDEQRTKIAEIHRANRDGIGPIADELMVAQHALHRATFADQRDDAEIAKLTATIATLDKQMLDHRVKTDLEVAAVLTAEQREKVRAGIGRGRGR